MIEIVGYIGMILLLLGWSLVKKSPRLSFMISSIASFIMVIYGMLLGQLPIILLNTAWLIITAYHLVKRK